MLRTCNRAIVALTILLGVVVVVANSSFVSADVQNGYYPSPYQNGNCNGNLCNYPGYAPNPGYFNGNYYVPCQSSNGNTIQCSGYLYEDPSGCMELAVPVQNGYWFEGQVYQYYTLQHLPLSLNPSWYWVTVSGQLYQGYNFATNGAACPGNYINVTSISP